MRIRRGTEPDGRQLGQVARQPCAESVDGVALGGLGDVAAKDYEAEASVGGELVVQFPEAGVGLADDLVGGEALAEFAVCGEGLGAFRGALCKGVG